MEINSEILSKVSTLKNLPTLPHILVKLIEICNKDEVDLAEISRIVEADPSLSSKILKLVNSAYYGLPRKFDSIRQSISYLGTSTIKNIAIGSSIFQAFNPSVMGEFFDLKVFWWHSIKCAVLARIIARKIQYSNPEEAFLAGLLHDIGRMVLWANYPKEYSALLEKYSGRSDLLLAGEIRQGITHCEIGAWMLHRWRLQSFLVDAILYHHEPTEKIKSALPLVQIIYVANILSHNSAHEDPNISHMISELFENTLSEIGELMSQADEEVDEVARALEIEIQAPSSKPGDAILENDLKKQDALSRNVRDSSLLLATLQNLMESNDEESIFSVVYQGLKILFDLSDVFFFIYDQEKNSLMGKAVKENERSIMINDLVISMKIEQSLIVSVLLRGSPLESFVDFPSSELTIIDQQIIRFIGREGILCLPMLAHGEYVGVIVVGLDRNEFSHLTGHFTLLNLFSKQVALSLLSERMRHSPLTKIQTERAVASSDIARKVVHEVNNPLSIIKNYLKILGLKLAKQNIIQDEISIINKEIDRISHLLRALTSFSESKTKKTESVDVNLVLMDLAKITRESLRKHSGVEVHLDLKYSLPTIRSDEDSIKQIFVNLIKNAAEAMPEGGNLYITTRHITSHIGGNFLPSNNADSQEYVEVIIRDDGQGIPDEVKSRLFDPFVSTKGANHSGLGLSIVHNLIKSLNGTLTCESERGKGTCFKIGFPIALSR
jgi:putative nucleotidyltransferase with HDIG domain